MGTLQTWLPGSMDKFVCKEFLAPSHRLAVRFLMEMCLGYVSLPVLHQRVTECNVFVWNIPCSTKLHILMGKCQSGKPPSSLTGSAWCEAGLGWGGVKKHDCVMLFIPSLGCNLIPDLNNLSLLAKGSGFLPLFLPSLSLLSLYPWMASMERASSCSRKGIISVSTLHVYGLTRGLLYFSSS